MTDSDYHQPNTASYDTTHTQERAPAPAESASAAVVLPTYNERETAPATIEAVLGLRSVGEIVVVDDDSPDRTWAHLRDCFDDDRLRVVRRTEESGLSSAVLRGFDEASRPIVAVMDADGQHPPSAVPALVEQVRRGFDVAIGSRHGPDGEIDADWDWSRYLMSFGASCLSWLALPECRRIQDPMSGMFCTRRALVDAVRDELDPTGFKILLEILAVAPVRSVVEVPIEFEPRDAGESSLDSAEIQNYVRHLVRLARESRRIRRPERAVATGGGD